MSTQLEQNLQNILNQKNTYLTPNNIRSGVSALGVTGTYVPPIKMYPTREAMLADTIEPEHEYGVVYGDKTQPLVEGMTVTGLICNENVTLDDEIVDNIYWSPDVDLDFGFNIELSPTSCEIAYFEYNTSVENRIQYTSEDGVHYTTTATLDERTIIIARYINYGVSIRRLE